MLASSMQLAVLHASMVVTLNDVMDSLLLEVFKSRLHFSLKQAL